ncbi:MAG: hypothetical protein E6K98_03090 [Thaumarchaeota archaeon]|nr:MAG: hypothetical protein E6K98_03090 [Nitrososphaerota archaeon]
MGLSSLGKKTKEEDLQRITPSVIELVDEWQQLENSSGKDHLTITKLVWPSLKLHTKSQTDFMINITRSVLSWKHLVTIISK